MLSGICHRKKAGSGRCRKKPPTTREKRKNHFFFPSMEKKLQLLGEKKSLGGSKRGVTNLSEYFRFTRTAWSTTRGIVLTDNSLLAKRGESGRRGKRGEIGSGFGD